MAEKTLINPSGGDIARDIVQEVKDDRSVILENLPREFNKRFRADRWFNLLSGELKEASEARTESTSVLVTSNPIGKAFDIGGSWSSAELIQYVAGRKMEGYYRRYAQRRRAGLLGTGKIANAKKRVPFLARVVYRTDSIIRSILKDEGRL